MLSVTPFVPTAASSYAGHQWYWHHLDRLARRFDVEVLAPNVLENQTQDHPWPVHLTEPLPRHTGVRRELAALRLTGRGEPIPSLPDLGDQADVVELVWSPVMPLAPEMRRRFPKALIVSHQIDRYSSTLTWARLSRLRLRRRVRDTIAGRTIALEECRFARSCDLLVGFKADDVAWAAGLGVETMVIPPHLEPTSPLRPPERAKQVIFVAAFNRAENAEGAEWLARRVWPDVVAAHPDATLILAGGNPGPAVQALASTTVEVTGFVDNLDNVYATASCVVAAVFGGGGMKFKVPQALAYGLPVVATREAVAGLAEVVALGGVTVTEDPRRFAKAVVGVLDDVPAAVATTVPSRRWVEERFFGKAVEALADRYAAQPK